MEIKLLIPILALGTQLVSVYFAIRLLRYAKMRVIAVVFILAVSLMALRRMFSLVPNYFPSDMTGGAFSDTVALLISLLILYVVRSLGRIFMSEEANMNAALSAEKRYRTLFNQSPDGVLLINAKGDIVDFNNEVNRQLGYTREEFSKLRISDIDPVENDADVGSRLAKVLKDGKDDFEVKHKTKQGEIRDVLVIVQTLDLSGQTFFHTIWRDVTERKQAEEVLRQKEVHLQGILEATADGILAVDDKGKTITANRRFAEIWNIPQSVMDTGDDNTLLNHVLGQLVDPDAFLKKVKTLYGTVKQSIDVLYFKDGRIVERYSAPLLQKDILIGRVWSFRDVTESRRTGEALKTSEERFRLAMQGANDGLWDWDLHTDLVYFSPRWKAMLGYADDELEEHLDTWKRLVHPDDLELTLSLVRDVLEKRTDKFEAEFRMRHKDGRYRSILSRAFLVYSADGVPVRFVGTHVDITERKNTEEELKRKELFIKDILESVDEGFVVVGRDYRIISANKAYCDYAGITMEDAIGQFCHVVSHHSDKPCFEAGEQCPVKHTFDTGEPAQFLHIHYDKHGNPTFVDTKAYAMRDAAGNVTAAIEIVIDVTEKKKLEDQYRQAQKMEAIGQLAGGVAHDFNNILSAIIGYGHLSLMKLRDDDPVRHFIDQILQSSDRAAALTQSLLAFSRKQPLKKELNDLNAVIKNFEKFLHRLLREDIEMKIRYSDDQAVVMADRGQVEQVIMNLVSNARDAMPNNGKLTIDTRVTNMDEAFIRLNGYGKLGEYAVMSVSDTGVGMNKDTQKKIFEPFFTTKEVGKGTGLGLATVYGIVKAHDGFINVYSEPGKGTTFHVYFPLARTTECSV